MCLQYLSLMRMIFYAMRNTHHFGRFKKIAEKDEVGRAEVVKALIESGQKNCSNLKEGK